MRCDLCGAVFEKDERSCHAGCPLSASCGVVCCPSCGYQSIDQSSSATVRLVQRAWDALRTRLGRRVAQ